VQWLETIAAAVPNTDQFYYHIPFTTNTGYTLFDVFSAARIRVPTLVGAKFTDYDTAQLMRCTELRTAKGEPYVILPGFEETYLTNLAAGGDGLVGAQVNFMPREFVALKEAFDRGDLVTARKHQLRIINVKQALLKLTQETGQDIFSGLKDSMRIVGRREAGFDVGPARQPLLSAPESNLTKLEDAFEALGFFTW
jgi:dihydrodipicolinate synthase/N-acetylneuraminate lyase